MGVGNETAVVGQVAGSLPRQHLYVSLLFLYYIQNFLQENVKIYTFI